MNTTNMYYYILVFKNGSTDEKTCYGNYIVNTPQKIENWSKLSEIEVLGLNSIYKTIKDMELRKLC